MNTIAELERIEARSRASASEFRERNHTAIEAARPAWAENTEPEIEYHPDGTSVNWERTVISEPNFKVELTHLTPGFPGRGETIINVWIDRNDLIEFISPEHLEEAARNLQAAAGTIRAMLGTAAN